MRVCANCHAALGCEAVHPVTILHVGPTCGLCGGARTDCDCTAPVANEIATYNAAVAHFVLVMRRKFVANLHDKGGWQKIEYEFAFKRLLAEAGELGVALMQPIKGTSALMCIMDEAADVGNFSVFIGARANQEKITEEGIARLATEAWIKQKIEAGECCNPKGKCEPYAEAELCQVCKPKLVKGAK